MDPTGTIHPESDADLHEYLTFSLDREEYGIPILSVQEIIGYQKPTPLPNAPAWLSGMVNIRGVVIPVVDIRNLLGMPPTEYDSESVIIITQTADQIIGSVVDQVNDVLAFTSGQLQQTPQVANGNTTSVTGVGKLENRLVMLLDMARVLDGHGANLAEFSV